MEAALAPLSALCLPDWREALRLTFIQCSVSGVASEARLGAFLQEKLPGGHGKTQVALTSLVLDAARGAGGMQQYAATLEETGFDAGHVAAFVADVEAATPELRGGLGQIGIGFERIVDVDWRLDYTVRSSAGGSVHEPFFFVALRTRQPDGDLGCIEITCNLEELQDLHAKIHDATKQVSRILEGQAGTEAA